MSPKSEAESSPIPSKRRRTSVETSADSKKPRGRPRVEPDDGTAADRRRTQIRLAQRAYRARAENKKSHLEDRSKKLETVVKDMRSSLIEFHQMALSAGLPSLSPQLAQQLEATLQDFDRMITEAHQEEVQDIDGGDKPASPQGLADPQMNSDGLVGPVDPSIDLVRPSTLKVSDTTSSESIPSTNTSWPYPMPYGDAKARPSAPDSMASMMSVRSSYADPVASAAQDLNRLQLPADLSFTRPDFLLQSPGSLELPSPLTYSFMETSFARRLHRASLEKALYLLSQPKVRDDILRQMFRVSYRYLNLINIRDQINDRLAKNTLEPLESFYDFPYRDFGGAGTHYTRSGLSGSTIPPLKRLPGPPRPQKWEEPKTADIDDVNGLEGEWFNPDDVEGYLYEERGIHIEPMAQVIKVELLTESPPLSSLTTSVPAFGGDMAFTPNTYAPIDIRDGAYLSESASYSTPRFNLVSNAGVVRLGQDSVPIKSEPIGVVPTPMPDGITGPKTIRRTVTIDVEHLIDELAGSAVCLGRFPGFRRPNVERALQMAIISPS